MSHSAAGVKAPGTTQPRPTMAIGPNARGGRGSLIERSGKAGPRRHGEELDACQGQQEAVRGRAHHEIAHGPIGCERPSRELNLERTLGEPARSMHHDLAIARGSACRFVNSSVHRKAVWSAPSSAAGSVSQGSAGHAMPRVPRIVARAACRENAPAAWTT